LERVVMTKTRYLFAGLTVALAALALWFTAGTAYSQNAQSWVSSTGTGTACTQAAPCANFDTAQVVTNAGGVISVLNPGSYSGLIISKSLTVRAENVDGGTTSTPVAGFWIVVNAGASDVVTLEGLHLNGAGIVLNSGSHLHIVRCVITNSNVSGNARISFRPNSASRLSVTDTVISNIGFGTGGGIVINPQSGGSARVNLERVTINGNAFGIAADGTASTAGINMTIADSMVGGNSQDGIIAVTPSGGAPIGVYVKNTKSVNNAFGIRSIGPNATVRVDGSSVIGNSTGLSFSDSGALLSFGNNAVRTNGTDGAFSGAVALQ
jgi:hypothetical protein